MSSSRAKAKDLSITLDDGNIETYDPIQDGRTESDRTRRLPLDRILPSRYQSRRVFASAKIAELADDIARNGLIHPPTARPHPENPGYYELAPGERRLRALQRLADEGTPTSAITFDHDQRPLVPIHVRPFTDAEAIELVMAENNQREDLSPWEWALSVHDYKTNREALGESGSVRALSTSTGIDRQTIADYLRIASIPTSTFTQAKVTAKGEPDHHRLASLSRAALLRIADANNEAGSVRALLTELKRTGDQNASAALADLSQPVKKKSAARSHFQVNIRDDLGSLSPPRAQHYLAKLIPAVSVLAERASLERDVSDFQQHLQAFLENLTPE